MRRLNRPGATKGPLLFAYDDSYLIDLCVGVIVDVEAARARPGTHYKA